MQEHWKVCIENDNYEVSDFARVRRNTPSSGTTAGKILSQSLNRYGRFKVTLSKNSKYKTYEVSRIVAHAFLGEKPIGCEINHKDEVKTNNSPRNLEYIYRRLLRKTWQSCIYFPTGILN